MAKYVSCSANQARVMTLESNLSEQLLQPGTEVTFPYRFDGDIFVWQNPQPDGSLGPEYRAERVR